ncbi:hypothetical protein FE257_002168 [Aspergillus nanangensis]|uniref:2,5-diamino-6-ribosylamino-4(3H)-pyrimidinone 5'-phosphate reductase n=1 Tax=Aspergillus nanangensis TaxID=2582783 RepID=A0AAD4GX11_ASPNN|nr:hypothetical protein FE257_002168 [Aspergillus nanangensis]
METLITPAQQQPSHTLRRRELDMGHDPSDMSETSSSKSLDSDHDGNHHPHNASSVPAKRRRETTPDEDTDISSSCNTASHNLASDSLPRQITIDTGVNSSDIISGISHREEIGQTQPDERSAEADDISDIDRPISQNANGDGAIINNPPNLARIRRVMFECKDPIEINLEEFETYWPFIDNVWVKQRSNSSKEGHCTTDYYMCRLRRPTHRTSETRPLPEGKRPRKKRVREGGICNFQIKVVKFEGAYSTVTISRTPGSCHIHSHDLDYIDKVKRNSGLMEFARKEAVKGYLPSSIYTKFQEEQENLAEAGGKFCTVTDVRNVSAKWRIQNPEVKLVPHDGYEYQKGHGIVRTTSAGGHSPHSANIALPKHDLNAPLPPDTLSFPHFQLDFLEPYLPKADERRQFPHVTLSYASSMDSKISLLPGMQTVLSGPEAKLMTHYLRSRHDAILIGVGTVLADNPGYGGDFLRIVEYNQNWRLRWEAILRALASEGIKSVMIEGGGTVLSELLNPEYTGLIDTIIVTVAPTYLGSGGVGNASKASSTSTTTAKRSPSTKNTTVTKTATKVRSRKPSALEKKSAVESKQRKGSTISPETGNTTSDAPRKRKAAAIDKEPAREPKKARAPKPRPAPRPKPKVVINAAPTTRLNVYVCGEGSSGELGLGPEKTALDVKRPRLNHYLSADRVGVTQVVAGGMHCIALTHDNKILTWGVNDQGALGRDTDWKGGYKNMDDTRSDADSEVDDDPALNPRESIPTAIPMENFPANTVFVEVAAGDSSSFALTDDGLVYGWGTFRSNDGILGFDSTHQVQLTPTVIPALKKIKHLACGDNHALALNEKGAVFSWGSGQQNQLGRRIIERNRLNGLQPREFGLPKNIAHIGCGAFHSFAVDQSGKVYAWGLNSFGETGIRENAGDDDAAIVHPTVVNTLSGRGVSQICGGAHHSLAVTKNGDCLVWGRLDGYQTGLKIESLLSDAVIKDERDRPRILVEPTPVPGIKATFVAAGSDHSLAIDTDGRPWSWGFSATYQTGQGTQDDIEIATVIENTAVRGKKLNWAGAGGQFSIFTEPTATL